MYRLMAYVEEWIVIHEQWNKDQRHMLDAVDFSLEGWQAGVAVKHVELKEAKGSEQRDRFIVLICDSLDSLMFVEVALLRSCGDYFDALLVPSSKIDEATAIYSIQKECQRIDLLLAGREESTLSGAMYGVWSRQWVHYAASAVVVLALAVGSYAYINSQVSGMAKDVSALNDRVGEFLVALSGSDRSEGFLEQLKGVETSVGEIHQNVENELESIRKAAMEAENIVTEMRGALLSVRTEAGSAATQMAEEARRVQENAAGIDSQLAQSLKDAKAAADKEVAGFVEAIDRGEKHLGKVIQLAGEKVGLLDNILKLVREDSQEGKTLAAYRTALQNMIGSLEKLSKTQSWQSTCWRESKEACYIYANAVPVLDFDKLHFRAGEYQLRVGRIGSKAKVLLLQVPDGRKPWKVLELQFDRNKEKVFLVELKHLEVNGYELLFVEAEAEGTGPSISSAQLVEEMKAGAELFVTPVGEGGELKAERMLFRLSNFSRSYQRMLESVQ